MKLTIHNENTVAVSGLARLYPLAHRGVSAPADQLFADACIKLGAGAGTNLTLQLTP